MRCAPTFSVSVFDSCSCFPGWIHGCETSLFVVPQQQALAGGKLWYSFFFFFFFPSASNWPLVGQEGADVFSWLKWPLCKMPAVFASLCLVRWVSGIINARDFLGGRSNPNLISASNPEY